MVMRHEATLARTVYISGPYGADYASQVRKNVDRAVLLGRLAVAIGLSPVVPHSQISDGIYGDDSVPEDRSLGLGMVCILVELVRADADSGLWVLKRDDGSVSSGTLDEILTWTKTRKDGIHMFTWADGEKDFQDAGLHDEWSALR